MFAIALMLTILNGCTVGLQWTMNAALGSRIGSMPSSFVCHLVGMAFALLLLGLGIRTGNFHVDGIPILYFFGGCLGVLIVCMANFSFVRIGVLLATILTVSFQLVGSAVIDHFGMFGAMPVALDLKRLIGLSLLILGAGLVLKKTANQKGAHRGVEPDCSAIH